ncbi:hypothetical protein SBDP1_510014 [Syntrophobacter sp. SbD1]|nr:hypothetical protein SBDP1_510014 [Syntrophobacter sp. SbD1]
MFQDKCQLNYPSNIEWVHNKTDQNFFRHNKERFEKWAIKSKLKPSDYRYM